MQTGVPAVERSLGLEGQGAFGEWLARELTRRDWGIREAERHIGVSSSQISLYVRGQSLPAPRTARRIAAALGEDFKMLMGLIAQTQLAQSAAERKETPDPSVGVSERLDRLTERENWLARSLEALGSSLGQVLGVRTIPVLGRIPAGWPTENFEVYEGMISVPERLVGNGEMAFALKVRGWSMTNSGISEDDLIIVSADPDRCARIKEGDVIVADVGGSQTVKLYGGNDGHGNVILRPNGIGSGQMRVPESTFRVIGVVLGVFKDIH